MQTQENYAAEHLVALFAEMARTYGAVNLISSFGFSHRWRRACVDALAVRPGDRCADWMAGMGEASLMLASRTRAADVWAVDFCPEMTRRAAEQVTRRNFGQRIRVMTADVLALPVQEEFDRICVSFGIKTLDPDGIAQLAGLINRALRPGGRAGLVEISVPESAWLRAPYVAYLRWIIPVIGRLCAGDPECYRSLAIYTESFSRRDNFVDHLRRVGLRAESAALFGGCARLYIADKIA